MYEVLSSNDRNTTQYDIVRETGHPILQKYINEGHRYNFRQN